MYRYNRSKNDKLRTNCTNCGNKDCKLFTSDINCRVMKCQKCGKCFDGVSEYAEEIVYRNLKK